MHPNLHVTKIAAIMALTAGATIAQAQGSANSGKAPGATVSQPKPPACVASTAEQKKWIGLTDKFIPICPPQANTPTPCNPLTGLNCKPPETPQPPANPCASGATVGANCKPTVAEPGTLLRISGPAEAQIVHSLQPNYKTNQMGYDYKPVHVNFSVEARGESCVFRLHVLRTDAFGDGATDMIAPSPTGEYKWPFSSPGTYEITAHSIPEAQAQLKSLPSCKGKVSTKITIRNNKASG